MDVMTPAEANPQNVQDLTVFVSSLNACKTDYYYYGRWSGDPTTIINNYNNSS